jgi:hypothetical protein
MLKLTEGDGEAERMSDGAVFYLHFVGGLSAHHGIDSSDPCRRWLTTLTLALAPRLASLELRLASHRSYNRHT